jgi:hypothetical protein
VDLTEESKAEVDLAPKFASKVATPSAVAPLSPAEDHILQVIITLPLGLSVLQGATISQPDSGPGWYRSLIWVLR